MTGIPTDEEFYKALNSSTETLEIEFKRTLNFSGKEEQSKIAKEICALCNYGGGWIILGRKDNGDFLAEYEADYHTTSQDFINQISEAFLEPAPNCIVRRLKPDTMELTFPIIYVPGFDEVPVLAKKNGPLGKNNRTIGVAKNQIYIRLSGPKSSPFLNPGQFHALIRKCMDKQSQKNLDSKLDGIEKKISEDILSIQENFNSKQLSDKIQEALKELSGNDEFVESILKSSTKNPEN